MAKWRPYITLNDYFATIQTGQLTQQLLDTLQKGKLQRQQAESWAINQVYDLISSKYDLDFEITSTLPYDPNKTYGANERCTIDFPDWITLGDYQEKALSVKDGIGYICLIANNDVDFDDSKWQSLGNQYDIYFVPLPYPRFELFPQQQKGTYIAGYYTVDEKAFWEGHIYTALRQTVLLSHDELVQFNTYGDLPAPNVFPNDVQTGYAWWKDEGAYTINAGILPTLPVDGQDPSIWILEDNRNSTILQVIIALSIWMLHRRISPNNIPKMREDEKNAAFQTLRDIKDGKQTVDLYFNDPPQGDNFSWGSNVKVINGIT